MLKAGEWECLKVRQDREEGQTPHSNHPDLGPVFQQPRKCRLGLVIQPLIGEISRGCNLPGEFISEELWNNELVSVVIMWEANCYFSWWSWLSGASAGKMHLPSPGRCNGGGGEAFVSLYAFSWFCFFSATKTAATTVTICFCNCSLKASSEKAVLIVRITAQLKHRNSPK